MKRLLCVLAAMAVLTLPPSLASAYEVPKDITIKRPAKLSMQTQWVGPVRFPHGLHAVHNACKACHHEESDRDLGHFLPCTQCHVKPGEDTPAGFYRAFHNSSPTSCLGCHKRMRLEKKAMPPISCTRGCHKLKKK